MDIKNNIANFVTLNTAKKLQLNTSANANSSIPKGALATYGNNIDISNEAKSRLADENAFKLGQFLNRSSSSRDKSEGKDLTTDERDKKIKELKEQVREMMMRIAKLRAKDDAASQEQVKVLEVQLMALNAQLMTLIQEKLNEAELKA